MKAAIYLRVSSKDGRQDEANQEPDCVRLCKQRGWEPVIFRERESGAKARPQWKEVVDAARKGNVGAVVFWALDRTGRSAAEICRDIEALGHFNVHVVSVQDAWLDQPAGPFRDLMLKIVAWFAEGERRRIIERTRAGLDYARRHGTRSGKPIGRPRVDPLKLERGRALVERDGYTPYAAAQTVGVSLPTLLKHLEKKGVPGADA